MDPVGQTRISCRNRRQAMDWALVLASQGIQAIIDDTEGWGLIVSTADYPTAVEHIRLYRLENRYWRWRHPIGHGFVFDWSVVLWAVMLMAVFYLSRTIRPDWERMGCMDNSAVLSGEWWRLFTAILLHGSLAHLAANLTLGAVLLGLVMGRYGAGLGLLASYFAGAGGNLAGLMVYPNSHLGVGASGMVMGGLGLLAAQSLTSLRIQRNRKFVLRSLIAGTLLFVLFGFSPEADVVAHVGGFVSGLVLGWLLIRFPFITRNRKLNIFAGLLLVVLVVTTSWLAFRR
jgi:membrane associated rhomboid family serine protease